MKEIGMFVREPKSAENGNPARRMAGERFGGVARQGCGRLSGKWLGRFGWLAGISGSSVKTGLGIVGGLGRVGGVKGRFEIEEILTQDKGGVVFRALDRETGREVVLRRLLPRGRDGGGLSRREADEYLAAAERLAAVREEGLRAVVGWGVDGVDGMPWLASEAVTGENLASVMRRGKLSFEAGRMLVEQGLAVQVALDARATGWRLATDPDSVVVEMSEDSFRFTWWVEPFPGPEGRIRGVAIEIAGLLEAALGWRGMTVPPGSGGGLADWIRQVRSERLTAAGALAAMASTTSAGVEVPLRPTTAPPRAQTRVIAVKPAAATRRRLVFLITLWLILIGGGVTTWLLLRNNRQGWRALCTRAAIGLSGAPEGDSPLNYRKEFRSDQAHALARLEGRTVTVSGVLKEVQETNEPGFPRYLVFEGDDGSDQVRGRFWDSEEAPGLCKKDLDKRVGETVKISGDVRIEEGTGRVVVHVSRADQVPATPDE